MARDDAVILQKVVDAAARGQIKIPIAPPPPTPRARRTTQCTPGLREKSCWCP